MPKIIQIGQCFRLTELFSKQKWFHFSWATLTLYMERDSGVMPRLW